MKMIKLFSQAQSSDLRARRGRVGGEGRGRDEAAAGAPREVRPRRVRRRGVHELRIAPVPHAPHGKRPTVRPSPSVTLDQSPIMN